MNDFHQFNELKIDPNSVSNALVLLVGVSDYWHDELKSLPGVPTDIRSHMDLWRNWFNYDIRPTKDSEYYGKTEWEKQEIIDFIAQTRDDLFADKKKKSFKYDAMIFVFCGHGGEGYVFSSDGDTLRITELHAMFKSAWSNRAAKLPRFFIMDCCRTDAIAIVPKKKSRAAVHTSSLICTLYGNSPGNEVDEDNDGGLFTQCLVDCLRKSVKYNQTMPLLDLSIVVSKELEKVSDEEQMCWVEGDPKMQKKIFNAKAMKTPLFDKKYEEMKD